MKNLFSFTAFFMVFVSLLAFGWMETDGLYFRSAFFLAVFGGATVFAFLFYPGESKRAHTLRKLLENIPAQFVLTAVIGTAVFFLLPRIFFDDAGFILRYLDHFEKGYWFRYNIADAPVYGISGFLHGLFCGLLCFFYLSSPETALTVSNYAGFVLTAWFVYLILQKMVPVRWIAFLTWLLILTTARMYLEVASCGLETSLHLAFVTGALYCLIAGRTKAFFLLSACMIVSKLDAVPVAFTCFLFYILLNGRESIKQLRNFCLWFLLPLAVGFGTVVYFFGSPLPQSAYAKLYYHSHAKDHWFPFVRYFLEDMLRVTLLVLGLLLWSGNILEAIWKKDRKALLHGIFGTLFLSVLALYYFYNPGERMMWYYAMPELFLLLQVLYGMYHLLYTYASQKYRTVLLLVFLLFFSNVAWKDTFAGLEWLRESVGRTETERKKIGDHLAQLSNEGDTLLSAHGLLSRPFKGYVIDASGLNSELATRYHLRQDSLVAAFYPDYIVNHAYPDFVEIYNRYNYSVTGIYRDITLGNYPPWIIWEKNTDGRRHRIRFTDRQLNSGGFAERNGLVWLASDTIVLKDVYEAKTKILHVGIRRESPEHSLNYEVYNNETLLRKDIFVLPPVSAADISVKTFDIVIDMSGGNRVVFYSTDLQTFELIEPLYELID